MKKIIKSKSRFLNPFDGKYRQHVQEHESKKKYKRQKHKKIDETDYNEGNNSSLRET